MNKISVIIPVYNVAEKISRCLDSLLAQTYSNVEIILVNDGSTDASLAVCNAYAEQYPRIMVVDQENRGVSMARNAGLDAAGGEYIAFVDADDYVEEGYLEKLQEGLRKGADISICGHCIEEINGRAAERKPSYNTTWTAMQLNYRIMLYPGFMVVWDKLYKKSIIQDRQLRFMPEMEYGEDAIFVYNYAIFCQSAYYTREILYHYVKYNDSSLGKVKDNYEVYIGAVKSIWKQLIVLLQEVENSGLADYCGNAIRLRCLYEAINFYNFKVNDRNQEYYEAMRYLKKYRFNYYSSPYVSVKHKIKSIVLACRNKFNIKC
ncbi:MAG: glycosyltransferase [Lachnospiraceae bacterium]|nr:glycosyltransferase [Lachnospiraceae bacterium]